MNKPYVVTNDLSLVFKFFEKNGLRIPQPSYFDVVADRVEDCLKSIFPAVEIIKSDRISGYLMNCVKQSAFPVISLTGLLADDKCSGSLRFSRSVQYEGQDGGIHTYSDVGVHPRDAKSASVSDQFNILASTLHGYKEIALADDVVFSGGTILSITNRLAQAGIEVKEVYTSIMLGGAKDLLLSHNIRPTADYMYDDVVDEVCMRDFIVGSPDGGRNVVLSQNEYAAAPYILPFGNIQKWASINADDAHDFSREVLFLSQVLWQDMEGLNERPLLVNDLLKPIVSWSGTDRIVDKIAEAIERQKNYQHASITL